MPATKRRTRLDSLKSRLFGTSFDDEETTFVTEEDSEEARVLKRVLKGVCDNDERSQIEDEFENGDEILDQPEEELEEQVELNPVERHALATNLVAVH